MSLGTLLYGENESMEHSGQANASASQFIATLMHGVTMAHMHHLMVTGPGSYAKHTALGSLYSELGDLADGLAESFIGCMDEELKFTGGTFELGMDPVADVEKLYEYVEENRMLMGTESHIQNDIDGICTLLASTLYKLRKLA